MPPQLPGLEQLALFDRDTWTARSEHPYAAAGFIETCERFTPTSMRAGIFVHREDGEFRAGLPAFTYDLRFDMALSPRFRAIGDALMRFAPRFIRVPILCMGSAQADECCIVYDRSLDDAGRRRAFKGLVSRMLEAAQSQPADLLIFKDVTDATAAIVHDDLTANGFSRLPSLPVAVIDLPFDDFDAYLASIDPKMRSDLRRKQRQSAHVDMAIATDIAAIAPTLDRLLIETRGRRNADFGDIDDVPPGFTQMLMERMGPTARCVVTRIGDEIVGCNIFLVRGKRAWAFRIGLSDEHVREHNLYFVNWIWMVRHCIEQGYTALEVGQTYYDLKVHLGCRLEPRWIYVRHRTAGWNRVVKAITSRISLARLDPDLKAMKAA